MSPLRNYDTNECIDAFIYKLINEIKAGAKFYATDNGAFIYHVEVKGIKYNLWGANRYYAYLARGGTGDYNYTNLWDEQMPSRRCCYDFLMVARKYCTPPETPHYKEETCKLLANLP